MIAVAALCACAVTPGIRVAHPGDTDRVVARAPPPGWTRLAVLPFGGDPAHRRPAEELAAFEIRGARALAILEPFSVQRWYARAGVDAEAATSAVERWAFAYLAPDPDVPRDEVRALAARLGADALVLGRISAGGAVADVVLVDGASGDAVAALRRAGSRSAADLGVHELAMDATGRALRDLVAVLRTPSGKAPSVGVPAAVGTPPWSPFP